MLKVGLTGSIAVGKSFVLGVLAELGAKVIDADRVAREVVEPGSLGLAAITEAFGQKILQTDGGLDREKLGAIVFADSGKRLQLNSILHPLIIGRQNELIRSWESADPGSVAIVDAALMIESGGYRRFDKLIVVHCRPEIQRERLMTRDGLSVEEAEQRINSQMPQDEKKKYADFLIDTSGGFEDTRRQTEETWHRLLASRV